MLILPDSQVGRLKVLTMISLIGQQGYIITAGSRIRMEENESTEIDDNLKKVLWQVEEAKREDLSISAAMNFINLSKEAKDYGNEKLSVGLVNKAKDRLFNDFVEWKMSTLETNDDVVWRMRLDRILREARDHFNRDNLEEAYSLVREIGSVDGKGGPKVKNKKVESDLYSKALDSLQKVWLKMKQEEKKGKDLTNAQKIVKQAKGALSRKEYNKVLKLCDEVMKAIQTPTERLKEETEETIVEISKTMKALFTDDPRSPKEKLFKRQIESLIDSAKRDLLAGKHVEAINSSRKAREILKKLEHETIKGEIPSLMIEIRGSLDKLRGMDVDVSYEDYLLRSMEETFWKGEYIESKKLANKLSAIINNAMEQHRMLNLTNRFGELNKKLTDKVGKEGYLEAKEYLDKAKILLDQKAFDMADDFLKKASRVLI